MKKTTLTAWTAGLLLLATSSCYLKEKADSVSDRNKKQKACACAHEILGRRLQQEKISLSALQELIRDSGTKQADALEKTASVAVDSVYDRTELLQVCAQTPAQSLEKLKEIATILDDATAQAEEEDSTSSLPPTSRPDLAPEGLQVR